MAPMSLSRVWYRAIGTSALTIEGNWGKGTQGLSVLSLQLPVNLELFQHQMFLKKCIGEEIGGGSLKRLLERRGNPGKSVEEPRVTLLKHNG